MKQYALIVFLALSVILLLWACVFFGHYYCKTEYHNRGVQAGRKAVINDIIRNVRQQGRITINLENGSRMTLVSLPEPKSVVPKMDDPNDP